MAGNKMMCYKPHRNFGALGTSPHKVLIVVTYRLGKCSGETNCLGQTQDYREEHSINPKENSRGSSYFDISMGLCELIC